MSCCESITNGAVPVATTVGPDLTLSNLYVGNVFSNFISVSNISIPDSDAIPGYVLGTTGTSVVWVAQSGGSGGSQWVGTAGNPIYYTKPVGIGSAATPTATLMVTGNIYASNAVQTPRLLATTANIGTLNVTGAVTFSNVSGNGAGLSSFNASNLTFGIVNSSLIYGNTLSNINASNLVGLVIYGNTLSNINASNLVGLVIYGNTLSNINASNLAFGIVNSSLIYGNTLSNINASNLAFGIVNSSLIYGNTLSNIQSSNITQPFANLVVSNTVTTTNLSVTGAITSNSTNTTIFFDTLTIPYINTLTMNSAAVTTGTLTATGATSFANIIVSNLQVTNSFIITATNVQSTNALSITNQGSQTALYVRQNEPTLHTHNVAEFWDNIQLAMVIDPRGNVAIHTVSSPGYSFTVVDGANIDNLTVTGSLVASGAALSSLNASNITSGVISSARIYGNTLSNIQSSNIIQPFANLAVSNSVTSANITASRGMGVGAYAGSAAPANSLIVSGNLGLGKNNPGYQLDMTGSAVIGGNMVIQTGGAMANPFEVRGSAAIGSYAGVDSAPSNGLIVSGNTGIGTNAPEYLLDVAGYMKASEIICNAFTTSTATNWNYVSNAASARSTSVGWQGIRQVFGDHITSTVYVYNNAVLETTLSYIAPGFGAFVAVGELMTPLL